MKNKGGFIGLFIGVLIGLVIVVGMYYFYQKSVLSPSDTVAPTTSQFGR